MIINLISDTITKPTPAMLDAMMSAAVGDDVFQGDPTVNALQEKLADLFGMEAALFCPSGTMTNQIAIHVHTDRLDEMICEKSSHVYQSETGGYAANSGIAVKLIDGDNGKITADQVRAAINPDYDWVPRSSLVVLENTCNFGGGCYYTNAEVAPISQLCRAQGMALHLDGARYFNAVVESRDNLKETGQLFDSISICLSKGLGAPVGSVLLGSQAFIKQARRVRKVRGGGMRQAGYLAAAGIYALDHHVERLRDDHLKAKRIAKVLETKPYVQNIRPVHTNILIFDVAAPYTADSYLSALKGKGIVAAAFGPQTVRFVTHLDITAEMMNQMIEVISNE